MKLMKMLRHGWTRPSLDAPLKASEQEVALIKQSHEADKLREAFRRRRQVLEETLKGARDK